VRQIVTHPSRLQITHLTLAMQLKTVALLAFLNASIHGAHGQTSNRSLCTCQTNGVIDTSLTESGCLANTGFFKSVRVQYVPTQYIVHSLCLTFSAMQSPKRRCEEAIHSMVHGGWAGQRVQSHHIGAGPKVMPSRMRRAWREGGENIARYWGREVRRKNVYKCTRRGYGTIHQKDLRKLKESG
jgi:hypothetical protein